MSRHWPDLTLDRGSGLWKRADDAHFWLEGSSSEEEEEIGWKPRKVLPDAFNDGSSSGEGDGDDERSSHEEEDLPSRLAPSSKRPQWELEWKRKFDALYEAIPGRERLRRAPGNTLSLFPPFPLSFLSPSCLNLHFSHSSPQLSLIYLVASAQYTDAILSCPGCFSVLCEISQRHDTDFNRYRVRLPLIPSHRPVLLSLTHWYRLLKSQRIAK